MSIPSTMRGAMLLGPEHIEIQNVPVTQPRRGEALLKIGAATTCGTDVKVFKRGGHPRMLKVPTLFGHEVAGEIAAIGEGVSNLIVGDRVVVANSAPCGECQYCLVSRENLCTDLHYLNGAFSEYLALPERFVRRSLYSLPDSLSFARAALTEPLACVLHGSDACDVARYAKAPDAQAIVLGGGPIGLLFVAVLARRGVDVLLADPNPSRLEAGVRMGASSTAAIQRGGGQAEHLLGLTPDGLGAHIVVDCTGIPEVWADALNLARPGGLVNLFGGCAPGTQVPLDTHRVHYSEITIKGVYHHRPHTFSQALSLLSDPSFPADVLLTDKSKLDGIEQALQAMINKQALKVVISS